ncbi:MAG: polysaccharide deacetylase family protein [bacterium]
MFTSMRTLRLPTVLLALALGACSTEADDGHVHDQATEEENWSAGYAQAESAKADGTGCSGVLLPDNGGFNGRIALTFDDGPRPSTTREIMEVLTAHNAPAAFFMLGKEADANRGLVREILANPRYIVASHSWSHPNLARLSLTEQASQMDKTNAVFAELGHTVKYFRAPYGSLTCAGRELVTDRGMVSTGWHIDSADWSFDSGRGTAAWDGVPSAYKSDMLGYIVHQVTRNNGGVLLFHDVKSYTANHLDEVLTKLETLGFTFVALDDVDTVPVLNGEAPKPTPFVGDACATDEDCGFSADGKAGWCLAETTCVLDCAGSCPDKAGKATTFCVADPRPGIEGGVCVSKAEATNEFCARTPGLEALDEDRYVGMSSARPATAKVCTLPRASFCADVACDGGMTCEYGVCGTPGQ